MSRYRIYFDESGVHSCNKLETVHERYLALCGVIFEDGEYLRFQTAWEKMKREFFNGDPDEPIILHRKELMSKSGAFSSLADETVCAKFNDAFLAFVRDTLFVCLIVVIDKSRHQSRYSVPLNPYHYCLVSLLQRYCFWLGSRKGDVMGESRGKTEDQQLIAQYSTLYSSGDWRQRAEFYQRHLTSKDIKLKPKSKNVAGLQLADLLAHPAKLRCLANYGVLGFQESLFGKQVADALWPKIRKRSDGWTKGWGEIFI